MRNLKALGLALVAALALSAVAASTASATQAHLTSKDGVSTFRVHGHQLADVVGGPISAFTAPNGTHDEIKCATGTYDELGAFAAKFTEISVTPTYTGCRTGGGLWATVTHNGCSFKFHTLTKTGTDFSAKADLVCPAGKQVEVHVYLFSNHTFPVCTLDMAAQTGLEGVTLTNEGNHIRIEGKASKIKYEVTNSAGGNCTNGSYTDGVFHANVTGTTTNAAGGQVPTHLG